jgi:hypothetical protein
MSRQTRVFISHTQDDREFAKELSEALRAKGTSASGAWDLPAGVPIEEQLRETMGAADLYVTLLSDRSLLSAWILFELGAAVGGRKTLFLVFLSDRAALDVPPSLRRRGVSIDAKSLRPSEVADRILEVARDTS